VRGQDVLQRDGRGPYRRGVEGRIRHQNRDTVNRASTCKLLYLVADHAEIDRTRLFESGAGQINPVEVEKVHDGEQRLTDIAG
jgi:hypothetical protein